MKFSTRRTLAFFTLGSMVLAGPGSLALAHTSVGGTAVEGTTTDLNLRIGHGCEGANGRTKGVIAQSVVFPTVNPVITTSDGSTITDLSAVIDQGSVAGLLHSIQSRDIFLSQQEKTDGTGNAIGFSGTNGQLNPALRGRVPFQFTAPNFVADTCIARLLIKVAIADICSREHPTIRVGRVNLWIPANGSRYATAGAQAGIDGVGEPATLIVNRDLAANPLNGACREGIDVTITPSAADVDTNLPIPDYWR